MSADMPEGTIELMNSASGIVLDVGPGTGTQLHLFNPKKISKMYGVEPAVDMHPELKENAEKHGFKGKYEIITAGAEITSLIPALAKRGLLSKSHEGSYESGGVFDTVVCCRVLCGVPDEVRTVEGLYRCLKPGGRMLICEHVVNPWPNGGSLIAAFLQRVYMWMGWSFWLGGCCLDRDTEGILMDVAKDDGGWEKVQLRSPESCTAIPFIVGELVKKLAT
jgi:SAM-dependent methyltransferase